MDNSGDWLYIVVLVIAGISSVFSSVRKKKQQQQREVRRSPEEQMYSFDEAKPVIPPAAATPFLSAEKNLRRSTSPKAAPLFTLEEEKKETPLVSSRDFLEPETLKKAVIYSEIFNRKY
jgi:hypothetical protein